MNLTSRLVWAQCLPWPLQRLSMKLNAIKLCASEKHDRKYQAT